MIKKISEIFRARGCRLRNEVAMVTPPSQGGDERPEVQEGPVRSGKCGPIPIVPRAVRVS